jgi:hypothetical protein
VKFENPSIFQLQIGKDKREGKALNKQSLSIYHNYLQKISLKRLFVMA